MRETFHGDLARLGEQLADMCGMAAKSMRQASRALLTADLPLAERVLTSDVELDGARRACEDHAHSLLALQAPVARDLRTILGAVYCAEKIERMGDLAAHIANAARFTHPVHTVPAEFEDVFTELGEISASMADRVGELIKGGAAGAFAELDMTDHAVDTLHARVLTTITGKGWPHGVQSATNLALVARFYERFADQAVSVAKRLEFAETGQTPTSGA
ncbi:phosphate signaling complex PhoU family protein [Amycolatopsis sp.]|jgi:phosphate transport system protein|uniref:phosphate signaling complex PhoU family protein n=1 Tax=Amycolatopsis sp. TaxID=37632 RepID=UPI002E04922C|nr:PhoU domain-containing protein [Amycolatopsis sp.]